jgi:hypothetical protein
VSAEISGAARPQWEGARRRTRGPFVDTPISRRRVASEDRLLEGSFAFGLDDAHRHLCADAFGLGSGGVAPLGSIGWGSELRRHDDNSPARGVTPLDGEALAPQQWCDAIHAVAECLWCQWPGSRLANAVGGAVVQLAE